MMPVSLMSRKVRFQQSGLTLLETMLALAVGVAVIMAVIIYYPTVRNNSRIMITTKLVGTIGDAVRTYAQSPDFQPGTKGYTTIPTATLQSAGLLTSADMMNPWQPGVPITIGTSGNYVTIGFAGVPAGPCNGLAQQLTTALPEPSPGMVMVPGHTYYVGASTTPGSVSVSKSSNKQGKPVNTAVCTVPSPGDSGDEASYGVLWVFMDLT